MERDQEAVGADSHWVRQSDKEAKVGPVFLVLELRREQAAVRESGSSPVARRSEQNTARGGQSGDRERPPEQALAMVRKAAQKPESPDSAVAGSVAKSATRVQTASLNL